MFAKHREGKLDYLVSQKSDRMLKRKIRFFEFKVREKLRLRSGDLTHN